MTNNSKWVDPLYNLIEDCLELLDKTPVAQQGMMSRELQNNNHRAHIGKYILMCYEYLSADEQGDLFQITCITSAQRLEYVSYYLQFVKQAVNRELP